MNPPKPEDKPVPEPVPEPALAQPIPYRKVGPTTAYDSLKLTLKVSGLAHTYSAAQLHGIYPT